MKWKIRVRSTGALVSMHRLAPEPKNSIIVVGNLQFTARALNIDVLGMEDKLE